MSTRIQQIVAELPRLKKPREIYQEIEQRFAEGDAEFVADLAIAVKAANVEANPPETWRYDASFKFLLRLFATTPGPHHVEQVLRLLFAPPQSDQKRIQFFASVLAASQTPEDLSPVFTGDGSVATDELRACLIHELVLRQAVIDAVPAIRQWAESPHWRSHPLGGLPNRLAAFEKNPALPQYSTRSSVVSTPFLSGETPETVDGASYSLSVTDSTTEAFSVNAPAAVQNWIADSNGRVEARAFDLTEPVEPDAVPELLKTLGMESLQRASDESAFRLTRTTANGAWRLLFAAASTGGAYSGDFGAYGRLHAWKSIAALVGAAAETSPAQLEHQVGAWNWFSFGGATPWFERVAWDLGLVAVSPDSRQVTVLAATDTD
ncbi:DUF6183 family protein [Glycomyces sp. NPDC046736]|uniref:DUF6183 family protein n=1 Tax=Glycomyces sp. NPDC046736 TaxID=3155615 RepID=UPI0033D878E2